ncbi:MAG: flavodoxin family protein [Bacillota bacterium]
MKKVLGLVVSERKLGNSELILKEIMAGVPDPCVRELIRLTELEIKPCRGCYRCLRNEAGCNIKDDFDFVINKIKEADALIIGLPVYFLGPHASFKILIDRVMGLGHYAEKTRGKPCVVVMSFGIPGWEGYTRTAALSLPRFLQMKVVDCWQVNAALPGESMLTSSNKEYARKIGLNLFTQQEYEKGPYECPHCGSDLFRLLPEGTIECPLCALKGSVGAGNIPLFPGTGRGRFSPEEIRKHFGLDGWLTGMKDKFQVEKAKLQETQKTYKEMDWWIKP